MDSLTNAFCSHISVFKFPKSLSFSSLKTQAVAQLKNYGSPKKISDEQKKNFIVLITDQNYNMKEAAKIAGMSYSTAKKVFTRFRKSLRERTRKRETQGLSRCDFIEFNQENSMNRKYITIVSTLAGKENISNQTDIFYHEFDC